MPREFSRTKRVSELIRRELASIISTRLSDPRVHLVSITAVDISKDMKHAKVFITQMGKDCEAVEALTHAAGYLRRELGSRLAMKATPDLRFEYDHSVEKGMELSNLIDELNKGRHEG